MSVLEPVTDALSTRHTKAAGLVLLVAVAIAPFFVGGYYLSVLLRMALVLGLVASWNIIGYTGYINFGQVGFWGTGAYLYGISTTALELGFWPSVLLGGIFAAILAGILGAITLKLSGHYFSIASLLLLIIVDVIFTNLRDVGPLLGLENLRSEILPPALNPLDFLGVTTAYYYLLLAVAVGIVILSILLERSRFGYGMLAINEDEEVAEGLGIPAFRLKVLSIILSGFTAGLVGAIYAAYTGYIDPTAFFGLALTFEIVFIGMIGSLGEWYGPVLGVLLFIPADQILATAVTPELGRIVFGGLFIVIMLTLPKGLGRYFADELRENDALPGEGGGSGGGGTQEAVADD